VLPNVVLGFGLFGSPSTRSESVGVALVDVDLTSGGRRGGCRILLLIDAGARLVG
jgi:hypothetical protein